MKPYLVTATDARGKRDTFAREAASLQHLRAQLDAHGYTDIEFVDDELSARLRSLRTDIQPGQEAAALRLDLRARRGSAVAGIWLEVARHNAVPLAIAAAIAAWALWAGHPATATVALGALAAWMWLVHRAGRSSRDYNALLRASARGDVAEVTARLARLRADPAVVGNEMLECDFAWRDAQLRARAGDLAGALADVEPMRGMAIHANGLFEGRAGVLHYLAGDIDGFLATMERGYAASGEAQLQRLDLAFALARLGDPARARELIAGVERRDLSALHQPLATATDALLALHEGDASGLVRLRDAVTAFDAFAGNAATWPFHGILRGHYALALALAGHRDQARAAMAGWEDVVLECLDAPNRRRLETELSA